MEVSSGEECLRFGCVGCLQAMLETICADKLLEGLQQTKLAGQGDRFGASLDLELAKDFLVVPFHRFQGEDQPLANLLI